MKQGHLSEGVFRGNADETGSEEKSFHNPFHSWEGLFFCRAGKLTNDEGQERVDAAVDVLTDFLPLLVFFGLYLKFGIYVATRGLIVLTVLGAGLKWVRHRRLDPLPLFTTAAVVIGGGLTLYFHDPRFLIWKPTLLYLAMAAFFVWTTTGDREPLLRKVLGSSMRLSNADWKSATRTYAGFFVFAAVLNLAVGFGFGLDIWVRFKVFGFTALMMLFSVAHTLYLNGRQLPEVKTDLRPDAEAQAALSEIATV